MRLPDIMSDSFGAEETISELEHQDKKRKADALEAQPPHSEFEVRKIVQTMSYDALQALMIQICSRNSEAWVALHDHWSRDLNNRKLYIRNLNVHIFFSDQRFLISF